MKYFAAFLKMKDIEKNAAYRAPHLAFLEEKAKEKKVFARGRFMDDAGGLVIYAAATLEEATEIANADPLVTSGARTLEIHEWDVNITPVE